MSASDDLNEISFGIWLFRRTGRDVSAGDTTRELRKTRARSLIQSRQDAGNTFGKGLKISEAFERVYGEPLDQHENGDGV